MSKPSSGLFASTIGAKAHIELTPPTVQSANSKPSTATIDPQQIRYSQTSVNESSKIVENMEKHGWQGDPIDIVIMKDGEMTTLDNTRVFAARTVSINVEARVHDYNDLLPDRATAERFATPKGGIPKA